MYPIFRFVFLLVVICGITSCGLNSEFMFKRPKDFVYDEIVIDSMSINYRIQPNDLISFEIYTNEAALMLEVTTSALSNISGVQKTNMQYLVDSEGRVEFPLIGPQVIAGFTVNEAQKKIEDLYEYQFNNPYVQLTVLNRRVIIFPSPRGNGKVLQLESQNISLLEGLAKAGGLGAGARANDILLVRNAVGDPKVYHIDLSTIEGLEYAKLSLESGDIIYVQPTRDLGPQLQQQYRPYLTFLSTIATVLSFIVLFSR